METQGCLRDKTVPKYKQCNVVFKDQRIQLLGFSTVSIRWLLDNLLK